MTSLLGFPPRHACFRGQSPGLSPVSTG